MSTQPYRIDVLHLDGVVLLTNVDGQYLGDPKFEPILAELDRRGVATFVHPNTPHNGGSVPQQPSSRVSSPFATTRVVAKLLISGSLERFPRIPIILAHAGRAVPYPAWRLAMFQERLDPPVRDLAVHALRLPIAPGAGRASARSLRDRPRGGDGVRGR